ncbi:sialic acid-binding Ig-like lectin 5 isoform X2 [Genypterus blacodes]|uniref:sialic acid-binding Ig-like lectin 5 isoform X2 n=1 Tax=Genypterus blacodes TaxID=154954 RepID=UPI003F761814
MRQANFPSSLMSSSFPLSEPAEQVAAMHVDTVVLVYPVVFAALWRGAQAFSPVPSVPDRVSALVGSCVVIPCSFTTPPAWSLKGRRERMDVRLRFRGGGHLFPLRSTAFNSEDRDQVSRDFQGRTLLLGKITEGDCSVKFERVRVDDSHVFEIALKGGGDLLWGKPRSFSLDVLVTPEAPVISGMLSATEGQLVTVNCTIRYPCPSRPPALHWHWERGAQLNNNESREVYTIYPEAHMPMLVTALTFIVSHQVKPRLRCEATYPGAKPVSTSKDLHVTFPPKDVQVQVQSLIVLEGANALLVCSCKADPPVSDYRWSYSQHGRTVHLHQHTHTVRVYNVTRDMRVRCSARNLIGRGESRPTALNIQYKPVIHRLSSSCTIKGSEVLCRCSVDSNPRPAVTWSVNGTVPPADYNTSATSRPDMMTAFLKGLMDRPMRVICFAFNAVGNDSLILLQEEEVMAPLLWLVIPAASIFLLVFLLSLLLFCCWKRAGKPVLNRCPAVYPGGQSIYQDQAPLYINCNEVTHIYTNGSYQLVYQNCTPLFVRSKQSHPFGRRGGERRVGERRRGGEGGGVERQGRLEARATRELQSTAVSEPEAAIYLEIL